MACSLSQAVNFQSLETLQEHGIAASDIQKLQNAGYHTVESVGFFKRTSPVNLPPGGMTTRILTVPIFLYF
jgi:hypothetical protein